MTDLLTGIAIALAVVDMALLVWCISRTLTTHINLVQQEAFISRELADLRQRLGHIETRLDDNHKLLLHGHTELAQRVMQNEKNIEKLGESQYAESGIYNVIKDPGTGKSKVVKAQALEDEWIQSQSGRSPDEILEAAERLMASGRAKIHS